MKELHAFPHALTSPLSPVKETRAAQEAVDLRFPGAGWAK